ncbi:MAG: SH3 domain-containing protein [Christensenellaceae bacterium]|jgi:hypothetical protein|nr:SH3 domain-containing protein [Christensenellaceae bacterium]
MTITNLQLAEAFRAFLAERRGYVYTAQGELWTPELAEKWKKAGRSVPDGRSKATYFTYDCSKWFGRKVDDCSGGIVDAIRQYDPGFGDRTANTFKSQFVEGGPIATILEIPGLAVWKSGHIGVYIGGGEVIEFRGTADGCVKTKLKDRPWTRWGKIKGVEYVSEAAKEPELPFEDDIVVVTGARVNVRKGPGTSYADIGTVLKDQSYVVYERKDGWSRINGGWVSDKYLRR